MFWKKQCYWIRFTITSFPDISLSTGAGAVSRSWAVKAAADLIEISDRLEFLNIFQSQLGCS